MTTKIEPSEDNFNLELREFTQGYDRPDKEWDTSNYDKADLLADLDYSVREYVTTEVHESAIAFLETLTDEQVRERIHRMIDEVVMGEAD